MKNGLTRKLLDNIFSNLPDSLSEVFETLVETEHVKLERIISNGQSTPAGEWFDQDTDEWVILLSGRAGLLFKGDENILVLKPGDYVHIPAHKRHRVEWTDSKGKTVWLAIHYKKQ